MSKAAENPTPDPAASDKPTAPKPAGDAKPTASPLPYEADVFASFHEWASEADEIAYRDL